MEFIINLIVTAVVILILAYAMSSVHVKSFWTALWVAFLVAIFNVTIGWLIGVILNLFTFFLLEAIVSLFVVALMIKLVDKLVGNFKTDGFLPALIIAVVTALAIAAVSWIRGGNEEYAMLQPVLQQTELLLASK